MSKYEVRIDDYVLGLLQHSGLDYGQQNDMSEKLKNALSKGKSKHGNGAGKPDFEIKVNNSNIAVVIENKWENKYLEKITKKGAILDTEEAIKDYAVNGAIFYAKQLLEFGNYSAVFAIGLSGEGEKNNLEIRNKIYFVFNSREDPKLIKENVDSFDMFKNENFLEFYKSSMLSEAEKNVLLSKNYKKLKDNAKTLNKLFQNNNINVDKRVIYVSGMLLAMQGENGLHPKDLTGARGNSRDGVKIYRAIDDFLSSKGIPVEKQSLMLSSFNTIQVDEDNDFLRIDKGNSINGEIFDFIYNNVYKVVDDTHIDSLGEMYSEFLKYALSDGKSLGIVLTPPYTTKLMNNLLEVDMDSKVIDLCTGSGGFLVASMDKMLKDIDEKIDDNEKAEEKIREIKSNQLLGVEYQANMYTLATTNMILRGDGSSNIVKGDSFNENIVKQYRDFGANRALLNPPFSYTENGMPFAKQALDTLVAGGKLAIIIQDSAGTGKAIKTNKEILAKHTLEASIKMPADLFQPNAGVQTSVYIFKAHYPHDFKQKVKFIDFSNDGYKRTKRGTNEIDDPEQKYKDILEVFKYKESIGSTVIIEDVIDNSGKDWNYTQHVVYDTTPTVEDFEKVVGDYLMFELSQLLKNEKIDKESKNEKIDELKNDETFENGENMGLFSGDING